MNLSDLATEAGLPPERAREILEANGIFPGADGLVTSRQRDRALEVLKATAEVDAQKRRRAESHRAAFAGWLNPKEGDHT